MSKWVIGKYIRLSDADRDLMKKEGKTESESVSHQKALIQNFVNEKDELKDCEQYEFFDDGFSGTNFDRPSFEKLIEQIKKGKINCVIVKDFSRFGRDYIELGDYLERIFPFMGVRFISINDQYDSLDYKGTTGGLDVVMKNIVYDYYSKDLSVKVMTAKRAKMKRGLYIGGHVPYGYRRWTNMYGTYFSSCLQAKRMPLSRCCLALAFSFSSTMPKSAALIFAAGLPGACACFFSSPSYTHYSITETFLCSMPL